MIDVSHQSSNARTIPILVGIVIVLALVTSLTGLFWQGGDAPTSFTTIHGATVEIHGSGIYRYDSITRAEANRGADVVTLAIALPLLILSLVLFRRGSMRGTLMLFGSLVWFLYLSTSLALGAAYNELFLVYVALMSASLFAFVLVFRSIDLHEFGMHFSGVPQRGLAIFMMLAGVVTLVIWLEAPLLSLARGEAPPILEQSTTLITHALDLAIIFPAAVLAGWLILRGNPLGYVMSTPLLVLLALLAPMITLQTIFQVQAGVEIPLGVAIGPIGGFLVFALVAIWFVIRLLGSIPGDSLADSGTQPAHV
jgi:hypothetical protein